MGAVASLDWQDVIDGTFPENPARQAWREAVATVAARAEAALPECNGRVDKAVAIVLAGDVEVLPGGKAKIASQSKGTTKYFVVNGACECLDYPKCCVSQILLWFSGARVATMSSILTVAPVALATGCLPGVVPYQATALGSHRRSWKELKRLPAKERLRTSCGNGPPWFGACLTNHWCPPLRRQNRYSCLRVPCNGGAAAGRRGTFAWRTSRDGAARPIFPPLDHTLVQAIACELIAETKQPLSRQSLADVTARAAKALGKAISRSTGWRILATEAIKPWRYKYWSFPRDPPFAEKAGPMLELYAGTWHDEPLGPKDHILSADEQTSIQARLRGHPSLQPAPRRLASIENADKRGGALQYLAAWDVRRG